MRWMEGGGGATAPTEAKGLALGPPVGAGWFCRQNARRADSLFGWLVADGWCWFVLREEYCWLVAAGYLWLVRSERKVLLAGG
jgi:hypothetical protein